VIFQIEAGQCFVSGTHEELMLKSETYRENAMHQTV
jgi:ATP-binding cassette subfamily B (MDR/TAP) protein 1